MRTSRLLWLGIGFGLLGGFARGGNQSDSDTTKPWTLHVAVNGQSDASGSEAEPLSFHAALEQARAQLESNGLPAGGIRILVAEGHYEFTQPFRLGPKFQAKAEAPIQIRAAEGAEVWFDGAPSLDTTELEPVTDPLERTRLAASAADQVRAMTIRDPLLIERLSATVELGLAWDGQLFLPARFPNEGYAMLEEKAAIAEISPPAVPVGKENYGVRAGHPPYLEEGRKQGWLGSLTEPRGAHAKIGARHDERAGSWQQWEDELARDNRRHRLTGFLDANWLQKSQSLVSANAEAQTIHLSQALAYGWAWKKADKPFFVVGLLCELDAPGEWHFDVESKRLFVIPPQGTTAASELRLPIARGFLQFDGAEHVHVHGLNVRHLAGGIAYDLSRGRHNTVSGAKILRSTATGVALDGQENRVLGCDLMDLNHHVVLRGGRRGDGVLEAGGNLVENCHLYQSSFTHRRVGVSISGVGNRFRHNLIHNSLGQAVTISGNDHLLEFNELFNIGFDEGDGGAMYAGGDLSGYGVVYRHNFFHHLMHVPGKVERSGIHLDDLQAGSTCIGNVFYKSAGKGIFMNGGAGHRIEDNVFLAGFRGVYNVGNSSEGSHQRQLKAFDPADKYHNTKENYVGRVERWIGKEGWNREPWISRHPLFAQVMNDTGRFGRMWPIRCTVKRNWFYDNDRGDQTIWSRVAPEARAKSVIEGDRKLSPEVFMDYEQLDLRVRVGINDAPNLRFEEIGLYLDKYRRDAPDPKVYRQAILEFYRDERSMPGTTRRYDSSRNL